MFLKIAEKVSMSNYKFLKKNQKDSNCYLIFP